MMDQLTQLFPPKPTLTEENVGSLAGKVYIVTGGNAGVGLELVRILYTQGSTVYIIGRSPTRVAAAVVDIESTLTNNPGKVKSLIIDLGDLTTVARGVSQFLAQETCLDVLFNNAGIAQVPAGSLTAQGEEAHMGTNCLGHFLLTQLLCPILIRTAKALPRGSVRVVFTTSGIIDMIGPPGGLSIAELVPGSHSKDKARNYSASKAGNWLLAAEFDKRLCSEGIVSVVQTPGTLKTKGWSAVPVMKFLFTPLFHEPKMGAYTELWAGLSSEVKCEDGGRMIIPWGRWHPNPRSDILVSLKTKEEGGTGLGVEFWAWCEEHTKEFA
jgi:NAD(P)-dependent dehydrogenase (short-subunit alcohol dehydrogenase family)